MTPGHPGRRLAELLPAGRLVETDDSSTPIPEDRAQQLAAVLRGFIAEPAP
ncbi:hypothetical protein [Streptomyces sp. NPDC059881]|uniref:hypothetical protein n=1 Tax=Streptomyces sp. NPDC059881 TaxID=3346986 RepID=UPI00364E794C